MDEGVLSCKRPGKASCTDGLEQERKVIENPINFLQAADCQNGDIINA
jgi:hypothetical protein